MFNIEELSIQECFINTGFNHHIIHETKQSSEFDERKSVIITNEYHSYYFLKVRQKKKKKQFFSDLKKK